MTILVLGGGNALGAYHGGAYEALAERAIAADWIVGASIGAITAAIIAGNAEGDRLNRLRLFWSGAQTWAPLASPMDKQRQYLNGWHAAMSMLFGRPTIFRHRWPGFFAALPGTPNDVSLYDHAPLRGTLERLIDFDRLNSGEIRFSLNAVDVETGNEVVFDTVRDRIGPEHVMASAAMPPGFPPVRIGERLLCDPGYVNNTPVDIALSPPPTQDTLCIALELFSLSAPAPQSLDAVLERAQDIMFASPTRRTIRWLEREHQLSSRDLVSDPNVTLIHAVYHPPSHELSLKTLDFSSRSIADRWAAGRRDIGAALDSLAEMPAHVGFRYIPTGYRHDNGKSNARLCA